MYNEFYGLEENPFSISPDPKYFYLSERHNQAFAHLSYGLKSGGAFVLLTGEVGTGKTTVSRRILNILPDDTDLAMIYHPTDEPRELYACICDEYGIAYEKDATIKDLFNQLRDYFFENYRNSRHTVVVIDEAQMLSEESLEQLRLLTNLETDNQKVVQIVLIGQPELQELLARPSLRQLSQRITARFHIIPLEPEDVGAYIRFRLQVAGRIQPLFDSSAVKLIAKISGGVPRLINLLADRCLEEGTNAQSRLITSREVKKAAAFITPPALSGTAPASVARRSALSDAASFFFSYRFVFSALALAGGIGIGMLTSYLYGPVMDIRYPEPKVKVEEVDNSGEFNDILKMKADYRSDIRNASNAAEAMRELFKVWGYDAAGVSCENAHYAKLGCYNFSGSKDELVHLNHPAVITLYDQKEMVEFYAVITQVGTTTSSIIIDGTRYEVSNDWLASMWDGEAVLLWRMLPSGSSKFVKTSGAVDFEYMSRALSRAMHHRPVRYTALNQDMISEIKEFQRRENLEADGKVGLRTIILLNARGGANMPRLIYENEEQ
ncbi:MAG: AAA family ATPase [Succinivibrionaceae bacterium]|nr:AAA family ATPase [Succinivibrionaceae bacterium]